MATYVIGDIQGDDQSIDSPGLRFAYLAVFQLGDASLESLVTERGDGQGLLSQPLDPSLGPDQLPEGLSKRHSSRFP